MQNHDIFNSFEKYFQFTRKVTCYLWKWLAKNTSIFYHQCQSFILHQATKLLCSCFLFVSLSRAGNIAITVKWQSCWCAQLLIFVKSSLIAPQARHSQRESVNQSDTFRKPACVDADFVLTIYRQLKVDPTMAI